MARLSGWHDPRRLLAACVLALLARPASAANLAELLTRLGAAVVVAHGAAGETVFELAAWSPSRFAGLVAIEASSCPDGSVIWADPGAIPFLGLYGDYLPQKGRTAGLAAWRS